jgi:hypothetical protein
MIHSENWSTVMTMARSLTFKFKLAHLVTSEHADSAYHHIMVSRHG